MPIYEYVCEKCEHEFEELVRNGEAIRCPKCEASELRKQWSVPAPPQQQAASLPAACNSTGPPCGPVCSRFPNG